MNTIELLNSAASAAAPPQEYWMGYSVRFRNRLDHEVLCSGRLQPTDASRRTEVRRYAAAIAVWILIALTATLYFASRNASAPVLVARSEKLPPRPFIGPRAPVFRPIIPPLPPRQQPHRTPEPRTPPPRREPSRPEAPLLPPMRVVAVAPSAIAAGPPERDITRVSAAAADAVADAPPTIRLTAFRLLRNGVEIARGDSIETSPGGVLWFADQKGDRFIISAREATGAQPAIVRGPSISFTWRHDQFEWLSAAPVVDRETQLWVIHDRVAPDFTAPRLALPTWPRGLPTRRGRLGAERERQRDIKDAGIDEGERVRVGVAKSVLDVLHNKKLR